MADIRIKDLPTTATQTSSDDFIALDGTVNGTRKLSAYNPSFGGAITGVSLTAPTTTNLTLAGGSTGASLVLGQGSAGGITGTSLGAGRFAIVSAGGGTSAATIRNTSAAGFSALDWFDDTGAQKGGIGYGNASGAVPALASKSYISSTVDLALFVNGATRSTLTSTGNLLIGTTTDSVNGKLQLATHTTSAGGIGFGTDIALYRLGTNNLVLGSIGQINNDLTIANSNGTALGFNINQGNQTTTLTNRGNNSMVFQTNSTTALTLSNTQAATFAGAVTTGGKITSSVSTATGYNQLYDTTGITTGRGAFAITSTGAGLAFGVESSVGGTSFTGSTAYASYFGTTTATPIHFVTNSVIRQTISSTGDATFAGAVTATGLTLNLSSGFGSTILAGITGYNNFTLNGSNSLTTGMGMYGGASGDAALYLNAPATGNVYFRIGGSDKVAIKSSGNLLVGGNTDIAGSGGLKVFGTTPSTGADSGALQVAGGIYAGAASVFGGAVTANGTGAIIKTTNTAAYLDGLRLQTGASSGSFYPGLSWHDTSLGRLANIYSFREGGSFATSMVFQTSIAGSATPTTALTINSAQAATFAGAVTTANKFAVSAYASNSFLTGNGSGFLDNYYNGGSGFDTMSLGVNYDRRNNAISSAIVATGDLRFEQGTGGQSNFVIALGGTNTVPTDRFTIASTGNATFAAAVSVNSVTPSTGAGSGALQVAGGIYAAAASVFGGAVTVPAAGSLFFGADATYGNSLKLTDSSTTRPSLLAGVSESAGTYTARSATPILLKLASDAGVAVMYVDSGKTPGNTYTPTPVATFGATSTTFAGAVAINNTVATAVAVASTHKVTMVIGGVTYYLLASNV